MLAVVALAVVMVGCGASFDPTKVTDGMTEAELTEMFGEPDGYITIGDKKTVTYGDHTVTLVDGVVVLDADAAEINLDDVMEGLDLGN